MRRSTALPLLTEKLLLEEYIDKEKPIRQIADEQSVAVGSVYNYLIRYGISTRKTLTEKARAKRSASLKGKPSPNKGKKKSEETKRKISEAKKGVYLKPSKYGGGRKKRQDGYIAVYVPNHPFSNNEGYVMEHHLVMEENIGRYIQKGEVVHHINRDRADNRIENLQLMTFREHARLHMKERQQKRRNDLLTLSSCQGA